MAAVYSQGNQERFVIYANTDNKHLIYWVNSTDQSQNPVQGTAGVATASPLAVTSTNDLLSLEVFLYYMDHNQALNRVAGKVQGSSIHWYKNEVTSAPGLLSTTLMAATTAGRKNYVYYIPDGQTRFTPFVETIQSNWFQDIAESP
ncbi:hypothetical protein N0V88_004889 [Collariella sp. IMI 366227]|nr:hypothetical protein N0V88_004889 [Collariella sp. IMI 366227]